MRHERPRLYITLKKGERVRHLLILFHDGYADTELVLMENTVLSSLARGTEFEVKEQAEATAQIWIEDEHFLRLGRNEFAWEPLAPTVALAQVMGFVDVYDSRFKKMTWPNPNFTGEVQLKSWPGISAKNGGRYLYALDQVRLHARPELPARMGQIVAPSDGQELIAFMLKYRAILDSIGPTQMFVLNDRFVHDHI